MPAVYLRMLLQLIENTIVYQWMKQFCKQIDVSTVVNWRLDVINCANVMSMCKKYVWYIVALVYRCGIQLYRIQQGSTCGATCLRPCETEQCPMIEVALR